MKKSRLIVPMVDEIYSKVSKHSEKTGLAMSAIATIALMDYFEKVEKKQKTSEKERKNPKPEIKKVWITAQCKGIECAQVYHYLEGEEHVCPDCGETEIRD